MKHLKILSLVTISTLILVVSLILIKQKVFVNNRVTITYPLNKAVFPADIASPTFKWTSLDTMDWKISIKDGDKTIYSTDTIKGTRWKPDKKTWDQLKTDHWNKKLTVLLEPLSQSKKFFDQISRISFFISSDSVNAPILYREIPLPFSFAEKNMQLTSYTLYNVASYKEPHRALEKFKVCGNCHSISRDGSTIALDFDASTRDKGGFFIAKIDTTIDFNKKNYLSWSKYQDKSTFGLFSKISNSGRYVVTTIKDRVISKKIEPLRPIDIEYSQVFFPVNGVLAVYDREKDTLVELPGANNPLYVQSNAIWTPDDKYIVFARAKAIPYPTDSTYKYKSFIDDKELIDAFVTGKKTMKFDLYKVPFNNGKGGVAEPIKGASNNGMSNYFPAISPDGKFLAWCESKNLMMLRPDSRIYMVDLETGKSHKLKSNFNSMNSWHAWSPNGKWLVFASKAYSMFTDMFITHIDNKGDASIPVLLEHSHTPDRAINYPEFINIDPGFQFTMNYDYVNIQHILDVLNEKNDTAQARILLKKYLFQEQFSTPEEYQGLSDIYFKMGDMKKAKYYAQLGIEKAKAYYQFNHKKSRK